MFQFFSPLGKIIEPVFHIFKSETFFFWGESNVIDEGFTAAEAQYAIDNIKADWNANALATAKNYQETMSMSKSAIYKQLISEYGEEFTKDEAQYAIDHLDD